MTEQCEVTFDPVRAAAGAAGLHANLPLIANTEAGQCYSRLLRREM